MFVCSLVVLQNLRQARHHTRVLVPEESKFQSVGMAIENGELMRECFPNLPNTCAWEHQNSNKTLKQRK